MGLSGKLSEGALRREAEIHPAAVDAAAHSAKAADRKSRIVFLEVRWRWMAKAL